MTATHADQLRAEIRRIEKHGHLGMGYPLEPHDVQLLAAMTAAADELDRLSGDNPAES